MPTFWPEFSPSSFHKNYETSSGLPSRERCSLCHLHRYAHSECIEQRHIALIIIHSVEMSWFSSELSEVPSDSYSEIGLSGFRGRQCEERTRLVQGGAIKKEAIRLSKQEMVSVQTISSTSSLHEFSGIKAQSTEGSRLRQLHQHLAGGKEGPSLVGENLCQWNRWRLLPAEPQVIVKTDVSCRGWGAFCQGESAGGCWSNEESQFHIYMLELLAVEYAINAFLKTTEVSAVQIRSDSTVAAYINRMGGTRSQQLTDLTKIIWDWCIQRQIEISAQHLPGKLNVTASFLSRHLRDRIDWILYPDLFAKINSRWGPLEIDLFASRFSAQLPHFYSWRADPEAVAMDAFMQRWTGVKAFTHPPWCLVSRVLQKVTLERATLVLITPLWRTQPWFPVTISMLTDHPSSFQ